MLLSMSVQGCIISDPPVFEQPEQTPPFLDLAAANPSIFEILQRPPATRVNINVPFRSEDAGDRLQSALFLNFQTPTEDPQFVGFVAPGTISEQRKISIEWSTPALSESACEQLTLRVTHLPNLDDQNEPIDKSDVALATWWVEVQVEGSLDDPTLKKCPRIGGGT